MLDGWRDRLERLLSDLTPDADPRDRSGPLKESMVELKLELQALQDDLQATMKELHEERRYLADAERRGRMASEVPDPETVSIAEEFAEKHHQRITLLERKQMVQEQEMAMARRDLDELRTRFKAASMGLEDDGNLASVNRAWRDLEAAGGQRPETDLGGELLQADLDRQAKEAAVDEQLAYLKRKMKRD